MPGRLASARSCSSPRTAAASYKKTEYLSSDRVILTYELPLAEIIYDFYDKLKSATRGYGTMDYEVIGFRADDLVKLDILVNSQQVDALSVIVPPRPRPSSAADGC